MRVVGQNFGDFKAMQQARGSAHTVSRITGVEVGRFERLAGSQNVAKIKGVEAAGDAHLPGLRLLDGDLPVSAPAQRAKPHLPLILIR